jgi:hypothetical protein
VESAVNRWIAVSGPLAGALILAAALAFGIARYAWNRATAGAIAGLLDDVHRGMDERKPGVAPTQLEELPAPVERYFTFALPHGQPRIRTARIRWSGEFQSRPGGGWEPFTALQHFTTEPPGFVWDAQIHMLPITYVRVRDAYQSGNGTRSVG